MKTPQELLDIAKKTGLTKGTVEKHLKTLLAPDVLAYKVNDRLAREFNDPLTNRRDNPVLPSWRKAMDTAITTGAYEDVQAALRATRDRQIELSHEHSKFHDAMEVFGEEGAAIEQLMEWAKAGPHKLEKAAESGWHKLRDYVQADKKNLSAEIRRDFDEEPQIFLVQHDWARAFEGAEDFAGGEFQLPYEFCAFEFRVGGRRIIVPARQVHGEAQIMGSICVQYGEWWTVTEKGDLTAAIPETLKDELAYLNNLLLTNIKAICVALEAEVATTEIVRAPHRLNQARERAGRAPLSDYRVIKLMHRSRPAPLPEEYASEPGAHARKRLHFRRGHWRHYRTFKTWVRWCLVGNPDLGFIDHDYQA